MSDKKIVWLVGYYKDDLEEYETSEGWSDDPEDVAIMYLEENYQVDEPCDMNFTIYIKPPDGDLKEFHGKVEYEPTYHLTTLLVDSIA